MNAKNDGHVYALPTEAQWEYSARGGNNTAYYFGDDVTKLEAFAWYDANSGGHTHEVAKKGANGFGLYDMSGNVWQWVNDWYGPYPTSCSIDIDPVGPSSGSYRVFRGGGWTDVARGLCSAVRNAGTSGFRGSNVGLRLVRTR
jgi:formylglycine-generating enzyme required for sulfatase activity